MIIIFGKRITKHELDKLLLNRQSYEIIKATDNSDYFLN